VSTSGIGSFASSIYSSGQKNPLKRCNSTNPFPFCKRFDKAYGLSVLLPGKLLQD